MSESLWISVHIDRPASEVYAFLRDEPNMPQWTTTMPTIEEVDGKWVSDSPLGRVVVAFVPRNEFGVLDHDVTLPDGQVVRNPMRVIDDAAGGGSELVFTLRRQPEMTDDAFAEDERNVRADLATVRRLLDRR